jgi:hypothetical protein
LQLLKTGLHQLQERGYYATFQKHPDKLANKQPSAKNKIFTQQGC